MIKRSSEDLLAKVALFIYENRSDLPDILRLNGEVGAGKTTLSRFICTLFVPKAEFSSPTYSLVNIYDYGEVKLLHFDLYRVSTGDYDWIIESLDEEPSLSIFEWSNLHPEVFAEREYLAITIEYTDDAAYRNIYFDTNAVALQKIEEWLINENIVFKKCNIAPSINAC
ncbi:MAG: tRNA (adenosine(37)-N6)-threonylcarbamoyltransferase complex ATPase subunit type 1 TsaE [Culicoidibacterales bacterium]